MSDVTVIPAEGRDYLTARCAQTDWALCLGFKITEVSATLPAIMVGKLLTMEGARRRGFHRVLIKFRGSPPIRSVLVGTGPLGSVLNNETEGYL
jgi:hypothetical protein